MQLVFLESSNGLRLTKTVTATETKSYPNVKAVNSYTYDIPNNADGMREFERLLRHHSNAGHCMLKGQLKKELKDESRAGWSDKQAYAEYLVLDLDGMTVPGFSAKQSMTADDVQRIAELVIAQLPAPFHIVSYIAQASSSLGLKGDRVSLHIYMALTVPVPAKAVKLWLKHINYTVELFKSQLQLSSTGTALKYPLDPSVADNSKLIFTAPPDFTDKKLDPFDSVEDRTILVQKNSATVDIAGLMNDISPEKNYQAGTKIKDDLRKKIGLRAKTVKITTTTVNNEPLDVMTNPDKMSITIVDDSSYPYIRCNVNGGDSGAYYFNAEDPTYLFNFKDEPIFELEKADRDFYHSIFDTFEAKSESGLRPLRPVVLRDFYTDTYYNGVFDPNINQFTDTYPLTPTGKTSIQSFMRSHGRTEPDFVPDAQVVFNPTSKEDGINLEKTPYYVNMYRKTQIMLGADSNVLQLSYGTAAKLSEICPISYKIIHHMLGSGVAETEHFINWLAYIYQTKRKSMTAWVFTGVPGTGKGLFANKILKPLFGHEHVPMKSLENIEEQFNLFMRSALFLVVDEFRMVDASGGSVRIADKLKNQITEPTLTIRAMRTNQIELPSYTNFIFLTNRPDAVKIEPGDRRYNVSPRQEVKLEEAHPEVIGAIDDIEAELPKLAGVLERFEVDKRMARTCMNNQAKQAMRNITMSVFEEFCDALQAGNIQFFTDVLDIGLDNTFEANRIMSAQRFVKSWIADAQNHGTSVIPVEHLRTVYHCQTEQTPAIANRQFSKMLDRNGLSATRKRLPGAARDSAPARGVVVNWTVDHEQLTQIIEQHFEDKDKRLIVNE